jgi:hypothetical protein
VNKKSEDIIFALRPGSIQLNDIVLTSDFGLVPWGIRTFTKSDFSHAALCTMPDMLFEAVRDGVMRRSVIGTFAYRPDWIMVLRPRKSLAPNHLGLTVADYAEALYGRGYSRRGAVASRFPAIGAGEEGIFFCSQVIAHAFSEYGVELVPGKTPAQIYPALLVDSPELEDVTDKCIRQLGSVSNDDQYRLVIDTAGQEAPGAEMRMNRRVLEAVQKELGNQLPEGIHSLTDLSMWLSREHDTSAVRLADAPILSVLEREGTFKWYEEFSGNAQRLAEILEFAARAAELSTQEPRTAEIQLLIEDLKEAIPLAKAALERRQGTARDYEDLAKTTRLQTFERLASIYRRQYDDAARIDKARTRLVDALDQRQT